MLDLFHIEAGQDLGATQEASAVVKHVAGEIDRVRVRTKERNDCHPGCGDGAGVAVGKVLLDGEGMGGLVVAHRRFARLDVVQDDPVGAAAADDAVVAAAEPEVFIGRTADDLVVETGILDRAYTTELVDCAVTILNDTSGQVDLDAGWRQPISRANKTASRGQRIVACLADQVATAGGNGVIPGA